MARADDRALDVERRRRRSSTGPRRRRCGRRLSSSSADATSRMPLPPPPAAALSRSGKPISPPSARASSRVAGPSEPGTSGSAGRARPSPSRAPCRPSIVDRLRASGPTKTRSLSSQARANAAFSARKPQPGWTASQPVVVAGRDERRRCSGSSAPAAAGRCGRPGRRAGRAASRGRRSSRRPPSRARARGRRGRCARRPRRGSRRGRASAPHGTLSARIGTDSARSARHAREFPRYARKRWVVERPAPGRVARASSRLERVQRTPVQRLELEEELSVLDRLLVLDADPAHDAPRARP